MRRSLCYLPAQSLTSYWNAENSPSPKNDVLGRLIKKVKGFADNELPNLVEKVLLDGKGFEPTSPATTLVNQRRFEVVIHADDDNNIYTPEMSSLDMAGVKGSNPFRPTFSSGLRNNMLEDSCLSPVCGGILTKLDNHQYRSPTQPLQNSATPLQLTAMQQKKRTPITGRSSINSCCKE